MEGSRMEENIRRIYVSGHRNPDLDSLASSYALAELRRRLGIENIQAICPGVLPERGRWLFDRFRLTPPESRNDVYLRISDIMDSNIPVIQPGTPLLDAVKFLNKTGFPRLPIVGAERQFLGMLSPLNLLSHLLDIGRDAGNSLTGRMIHSSIDLITQVLDGEILTGTETGKTQDFKVYVAAMGLDSFETHMPRGEDSELVLITGDRPDIHLKALQRRIRLLIVTSEKSVEPLILKEADVQGVTIMKTKFDSASVIRRIKFSMPVEDFTVAASPLILHPQDRVTGVSARILNTQEDVIPVADLQGRFEGVVLKQDVSRTPPYRMILVDHNETEQSIPGIEEIPVVEVVDHHRIGMRPTVTPIKFTGDVVGSTCTLVAAMFKSHGESLTPDLAGLLIGGIVSDTLNLKSPTTAPLDRRMLEWLERIAGIKAADLMEQLLHIDSPLASKPPHDVIESDRKSYTNGNYKFSLSQVEETNLELLHQRQDELMAAMRETQNTELLQFIGLMVTDAVRENSELLLIGSPEILQALPYQRVSENLFLLPGVLSRKKQLLPQLLSITSELSRP